MIMNDRTSSGIFVKASLPPLQKRKKIKFTPLSKRGENTSANKKVCIETSLISKENSEVSQ